MSEEDIELMNARGSAVEITAVNQQRNLKSLLKKLSPKLYPQSYVFSIVKTLPSGISPIATFQEDEGLSLVLMKEQADALDLPYEGVFSRITLQVHSSLEAVGLTGLVASELAKNRISANFIAAINHDHVFVPEKLKGEALNVLLSLAADFLSGDRK